MALEKKIKYEIKLPEGTEAFLDNHTLKIKGTKSELFRKFAHPKININVKERNILVECNKPTKREKTYVGTFVAHIKNMILGASKEFKYKLKICSGHFPITVNIDSDKVIIKNFLGEKVPRKARLLPGVKAKVTGDEIIIEGSNKEDVGQSAANIEIATRITNRDRRVFQDGIFITSKGEENE